MLLLVYLIAVSYTHLDVYKRQVFTDNARKRNASKKKEKPKEHSTRRKRNLKNGNGKVSVFYRIIFICWKNGK